MHSLLHAQQLSSTTQDNHRSSGPTVVHYELTQACGVCCSKKGGSDCRCNKNSELSPLESRQLIDELCEFPQPPAIVFTGGDPLERADLFSLVKYARNRGLAASIELSATRLVTRQALWRLRGAGISQVALTLNGADPQTHDRLCGLEGSYDRTWEIIHETQKLGIPLKIQTTLETSNLAHLNALADHISGAGAVHWSVYFLVPKGDPSDPRRLTAQQCEQAFGRLWMQSRLQSYLIETVEAPHYYRFVAEYLRQFDPDREIRNDLRGRQTEVPPSAPNRAKDTMFINRAGLIYPSKFLPIVCGLFPHNKLVDVFRGAPIFQRLRESSRLEGKCSLCEYRHRCGGSRARAYAVTGNLFAQEPDCAYVPIAMRAT